MKNTVHDQIEIDLDGSIEDAIAKLAALKAEYPDGEISLENEYAHGESYAKLYLQFTREKTEAEVNLEAEQAKLSTYRSLLAARQTFTSEGQEYPRNSEIEALEAELGAFAKNAGGWLQLYDGEVIMYDGMIGGYDREGRMRFKRLDMGDLMKDYREAVGVVEGLWTNEPA